MFWNKNKNKKTEETKEQAESKNQVSVEENTQQKDNTQFQSIRNAEDLMKEVIDEFTKTKISYIADVRKDELSKKNFMKEVRKHLTRYYPNYEAYYDEALALIDSYIFGYFRLTPLIEDKDITDIKVVDYNNIRVKKKGKRMDSGVKFKSKEEYINFVNYVATKNQINISNINALQIFDDKSSVKDFILRFVISMPIITTPEIPHMAIRKVARDFPEMDDLVKAGMMTEDMKNYLVKRFHDHSMLVCGPSASGKTTFLNAVKETIPESSSCLIVQETEELSAKNHPDMLFEHPVVNRGESKVKYTLYDIIAAGLLMDIERFIIGEIKGAEAIHLLNASYTGHICAATVHSESAMTALDKVVDYAKYASDYSKPELMKMVTSFKTIVYIYDFKVIEVVEIVGWDDEKREPIYKTIYREQGENKS